MLTSSGTTAGLGPLARGFSQGSNKTPLTGKSYAGVTTQLFGRNTWHTTHGICTAFNWGYRLSACSRIS